MAFGRSSSETRFGIPAYTAGRKKPVAIPDERREDDDRGRALCERQRGEDRDAREIGRDEQAPSREAVDERPEQQPDHDDRKEVRDQERADPRSGPRPVEDVDGQRQRRQIRSGSRAERREQKSAIVGFAAYEPQASHRLDATSLVAPTPGPPARSRDSAAASAPPRRGRFPCGPHSPRSGPGRSGPRRSSARRDARRGGR